MNSLVQDRRSFLTALAALAAIVYFAAGGAQAPQRLEVPQASVAEAKALVDAGAIVVDVRSAEHYARRHLPGAVLLPLDALQAGIPDWLAASKDRPVVVYCNDGAARGPEATALLQSAGFAQAVNLTAGVEGWAKAELPLVKG